MTKPRKRTDCHAKGGALRKRKTIVVQTEHYWLQSDDTTDRRRTSIHLTIVGGRRRTDMLDADLTREQMEKLGGLLEAAHAAGAAMLSTTLYNLLQLR